MPISAIYCYTLYFFCLLLNFFLFLSDPPIVQIITGKLVSSLNLCNGFVSLCNYETLMKLS